MLIGLRKRCTVSFVLFLSLSVEGIRHWINDDCLPRFKYTTDVQVSIENVTSISMANLNTATVDDPEFLSKYPFPRNPVKVADCLLDDPVKWIGLEKPVVLRRCQFFNEALKWNLRYLSEQLTDEYGVSVSSSRKFLYYDSTVDYQNYEKAGWKPPYRIQYNTFDEFLEVAMELSRLNNGTHAYFQTLLLDDDRNTSVKSDLNSFDYTWLLRVAFELGWSTNILNMLFVGMPNVVTPLHYDIMQNIFIQLQGKKRFILFNPDQFTNLYPYPVGHPHDRQSQVNLDEPDYQRFPKFHNVQALEAILEPGDVLYVPTSWWHHVESNRHNFTVSLNFWFEDNVQQRIFSKIKDSTSLKAPSILTPTEDVAFKRHVESIVYNMTRSKEKTRKVFEDILTGRFGE